MENQTTHIVAALNSQSQLIRQQIDSQKEIIRLLSAGEENRAMDTNVSQYVYTWVMDGS
jgi:hypothetical protein